MKPSCHVLPNAFKISRKYYSVFFDMQNLGFSLDLKTGSSLLLVPTALTRATQFTKSFKSKLKWLPNIPYINCIFAKARE